MRKNILIVALLCVSAPHSISRAESQSDSQINFEKRVQLSKEIFDIRGRKKEFDETFAPLFEPAMELKGLHPKSPEEEIFLKNLKDSLKEGINLLLRDSYDQFIQVYALTFTETELRDQIIFFRTPSGQAFIEKTEAASEQARSQAIAMIPRGVDYAEKSFCAKHSCNDQVRGLFRSFRQGAEQAVYEGTKR